MYFLCMASPLLHKKYISKSAIVGGVIFLKARMEILINWEGINTEDEFYSDFLPKVEAPNWHGRNLDALADSLIAGSINGIEPPYTILSINTDSNLGEFKIFQAKVLKVLAEAAAEPEREIKILLK